MSAIKKQTASKKTPAVMVKAAVRLVSAWVALRPFAPDDLIETMLEIYKYLKDEHAKTNDKKFQSFDVTLLAEFGRKGKREARKPGLQLETMIENYLSAFDAFLHEVPHQAGNAFLDVFSSFTSDSIEVDELERLALRRAFGLAPSVTPPPTPKTTIYNQVFVNKGNPLLPVGTKFTITPIRPKNGNLVYVMRDSYRVVKATDLEGGDFLGGWVQVIGKEQADA